MAIYCLRLKGVDPGMSTHIVMLHSRACYPLHSRHNVLAPVWAPSAFGPHAMAIVILIEQ